MDVIFKKYFWAVNLLTLLILAWIVAAGVNDFVGGALFAVPRVHVDADDKAGPRKTPQLGRVAEADAAADVLKERHPFVLEIPEVEEPKVEEPKVEEPVEEKEPEGELAESELPIDLIGTLVATDGGSSMATLSVEGENKLAWIGSEFLEGKAKIVSIQPRHVVVKEAIGFKVIKLWADKTAKAGPARPGRPGARPARPTPRRPKRPTPRRPARPNVSKGVKKTGAYDYEIDKKMLDEQLADLSKLGTQARIVPNYRGGKYQGFKLVGVRPGSLYRSIGIRSGDVIKSVNGSPIDSPNKAIELFEKLKNSSNISLDIERRGQPKELSYTIK